MIVFELLESKHDGVGSDGEESEEDEALCADAEHSDEGMVSANLSKRERKKLLKRKKRRSLVANSSSRFDMDADNVDDDGDFGVGFGVPIGFDSDFGSSSGLLQTSPFALDFSWGSPDIGPSFRPGTPKFTMSSGPSPGAGFFQLDAAAASSSSTSAFGSPAAPASAAAPVGTATVPVGPAGASESGEHRGAVGGGGLLADLSAGAAELVPSLSLDDSVRFFSIDTSCLPLAVASIALLFFKDVTFKARFGE